MRGSIAANNNFALIICVPCAILIGLVAVAALAAGTASVTDPVPFDTKATAAERAAVQRDAANELQHAAQFGVAVNMWAGHKAGATLIRVESPGTCGGYLDGKPVGAGGACLTLAYLALSKHPVWRGASSDGGMQWPLTVK